MVDPRALYLDLMKRCLINMIYGDLESTPTTPFDPVRRMEGRDWPRSAHTMIGWKRLENIQACIRDILDHDVRGDLIEAGVWRGGASIFMRAVLKAFDADDRYVWVADSFRGLPPPNPDKYPVDAASTLYTRPELAVSLDDVQRNFDRYGLLDDRVRFLAGWFRDSLPCAPIRSLALIRLDGDMYESTMDSLTSLYPKLSPGGYIIVDDYGADPGCRQAIQDFRADRHIDDPLIPIDWTGVYWKSSPRTP